LNREPLMTALKGLIFNIQRFSIHDGPGIRTTVFFKGCPLRCLWCSNPESQDVRPQIMVRDAKCIGCGECAKACPEKAISMTADRGRVIDWKRCTQCLKCAEVCVAQSIAVAGRYVDVDEIINEVEQDRIFYKNSGGGVTVSGGEPLMQAEFLAVFLKTCKDRGLHTALDTSGYFSREAWSKVRPYLDLVLYDVKHLDPRIHREYTGMDNQIILANAKIVAADVRTWFRIPLIAGLNDSPEDIKAVAEMGRAWGVEKLSLLPYHEGGVSKAGQIGRIYRFDSAKPPTDEQIERLREIAGQVGLAVTVRS